MSSPLKGASPGKATEAYCNLCSAPLVAAAKRNDAIKVAVRHFESKHPEHGNLLLEGHGGDLTLRPAPYRCDLCNDVVEAPVWTYLTGARMQTEDPHWLVCDACEPLVEASRLPDLVVRALSVQRSQIKAHDLDQRKVMEGLFETLARFLAYRLPERSRTERLT